MKSCNRKITQTRKEKYKDINALKDFFFFFEEQNYDKKVATSLTRREKI